MREFYNSFLHIFERCIIGAMLLLWLPASAMLPSDDNSSMGTGEIPDKVYSSNINTVQFHKSGLVNSLPFYELNSNDHLTLSFDVMGAGGAKNFQYTIIHCDAEWKPSNLIQSEYIDGVFQDYVSLFSFSTNTYQKYVHYRIELPGGSMKPKISGNYILKVFLNDPDRPVLTKRFFVVQSQVEVGADVHRASYARYRDTKQEVDFTINTKGLVLQDPYNEIKVVIRQNGRWDNVIAGLKPLYVTDKNLVYNYEEGNLFDGGAEFRAVDTRDTRFKGTNIKLWTWDSFYTATLYADEDRSEMVYSTIIDQDGNYVIVNRQGQDASTDADYTYVIFNLRPNFSGSEGQDVYVFGGLTNWQLDPKYKMKYSPRDGYTCRAYLKQGYYDYCYALVNEKGEIDATAFEGSHWETENNYTLYVYYHPPNMATDILVGVQTINTALR